MTIQTRKVVRRIIGLCVCGGLLALSGLTSAQTSGDDELNEIVVTSSRIGVPRRQVGAAISVIDEQEIALRGFNSVADLLRTQPGIGVSSNGGVGTTKALRIRGEEGYRTMVIIDGVYDVPQYLGAVRCRR